WPLRARPSFPTRRSSDLVAGLTGTPYDSGASRRDQAISKAGNKRVRWAMVELAWAWLRWQPDSALTHWFWDRFGHGGARQRRVEIGRAHVRTPVTVRPRM